MSFELTPVVLHLGFGDNVGMLIFQNGALLAVASELGEIHGDRTGSWYLEKLFDPYSAVPDDAFASLEGLTQWLAERYDR